MTKFKINDHVIDSDGDQGVIVGIEPNGVHRVVEVGTQEIYSWWESELTLVESGQDDSSQPETIRGKLLLEAKRLIEGDRNKTYGTPTENFTNIATVWNVIFKHKMKEDFSPADVAQAMIALKLCRNIADFKYDTFVDIAGYSACAWESTGLDTPSSD